MRQYILELEALMNTESFPKKIDDLESGARIAVSDEG